MNKVLSIQVLAVSVVLPGAVGELVLPPQDQGIPYTRSAPAAAMAVMKDYVVLHPLSRYAYLYGYKVRIDNRDILRGEPMLREDGVYVPEPFAGVVRLSPDLTPRSAPAYLQSRWVYDVEIPRVGISDTVRRQVHDGRIYLNIQDLARQEGCRVTEVGEMLFIARHHAEPAIDGTLLDTVVTQFDTPEKYADPAIAPRYIPQLIRQGEWTRHVAVDAEDLALLDGPEPDWPVTPKSAYRLDGFAFPLLGSEVPEPGVYPRILFSAADLPMIRERIAGNRIATKSMIEIEVLLGKSWLNPDSDDGKVFDKLATGDLDGLDWDAWQGGRRIPRFPGRFDGYTPVIYSSHIEYNAQCLVMVSLYALIKEDHDLGRKAARALANLYRLQEPHIDRFLSYSDSEFGGNPGDANASTTQWRGLHASVAHMDLPFALDFAGRYMSDKDKAFLTRLIAKVTYGRRTNGGDGPRRNWRDINHVTWHTTHLLALMAIEGLEGFDPEAYASGEELIADFLEWGINEHGILYESNGKSGGGLQFQILNMIGLARRGNNLWGHPHWRNLVRAQVLNTAPNGRTSVSSGTWSTGLMSVPATMLFHAFYPTDPYADFLLSCDAGDSVTTLALRGFDPQTFDPESYRDELQQSIGRTRLPAIGYPGFTMTLLYDTDWRPTRRHELTTAPLDYVDADQGILSSFSTNDADATWMHMLVRNNHYLGSGHHHADAGMFHFSAGGVNWITESSFLKAYDGRFHNQVLIDGLAQPDDIQGRAHWVGSMNGPGGAIASANLAPSYSHVWKNQFIYFDTDDWGPQPDQFDWSLARDPVALKAFRGTQRYKMRPWWATSNFSCWYPVLQRPYNPVEYAWRTVGLVRGTHAYGMVVDDIKKDDAPHLYQWSAMPGPGVWAAKTDLPLPRNQLLLAKQGQERVHAGSPRLRPRTGDPLLLICVLGGEGAPADFEEGPSKSSRFALDPHGTLDTPVPEPVAVPVRIETRGDGPHWKDTDQVQFFYDQIVGGCFSRQAHFRALLIPVTHGQGLPDIQYDAEAETARVTWPDQEDLLYFRRQTDHRTLVEVVRNGNTVLHLDPGVRNGIEWE